MITVAGDIGGTKSLLALVECRAGAEYRTIHEARYQSNDFGSLEELLQKFLEESGQSAAPLERMVLAIAGPVVNGVSSLTNLEWMVSEAELCSAFGLKQAKILNDFQAAALGTLALQGSDYLLLHPGRGGDNGVRLVMGAGTGLGLAYLCPDGQGGYTPIATEGGHVDFAPASEQEIALLQYLQRHYPRVSYERILSGSGLVELFCFCAGRIPDDLPLSAEWVNRAATEEGNPIAVAALRLFAAIYGRFAGNMVLAFGPGAGLYLTGGVTAKVSQWLESDEFRSAYLDKGRMSEVVAQTTVYLVKNERLGLQGAIHAVAYGI